MPEAPKNEAPKNEERRAKKIYIALSYMPGLVPGDIVEEGDQRIRVHGEAYFKAATDPREAAEYLPEGAKPPMTENPIGENTFDPDQNSARKMRPVGESQVADEVSAKKVGDGEKISSSGSAPTHLKVGKQPEGRK